jgi:methylphosphotriester-DNA--protein-cysteine methyltransferase
VQKIDDKDAIHFHTAEEAEDAGLRPCAECIPSGKKESKVEESSN